MFYLFGRFIVKYQTPYALFSRSSQNIKKKKKKKKKKILRNLFFSYSYFLHKQEN